MVVATIELTGFLFCALCEKTCNPTQQTTIYEGDIENGKEKKG